jgi:hypothetical protein
MPAPALLLLDDPTAVLDPATPLLRADDLGVVRGGGRLRDAPGRRRPAAFLDLHLARMQRSAARVGIALPGGWTELARAAAATQDDGFLRLTCTKGAPDAGPVGFAVAGPISDEIVRGREHGIRVVTLTLGVDAGARVEAPWLLGGVKSTSYASNMATQRAAVERGAQDAIWVSGDGEVLEAPTATVAWVRGGGSSRPGRRGRDAAGHDRGGDPGAQPAAGRRPPGAGFRARRGRRGDAAVQRPRRRPRRRAGRPPARRRPGHGAPARRLRAGRPARLTPPVRPPGAPVTAGRRR